MGPRGRLIQHAILFPGPPVETMSTPLPPADAPETGPTEQTPLRHDGWLSPSSTLFSDSTEHRARRAAGATAGSIVAHIVLVAIGMWLLTRPRPMPEIAEWTIPEGTLVYLEQAPGPGGGGGGAPEPAAPEPLEIPETEQPEPEPVPITPPPPTPPPPEPPPAMSVPVMTANATRPQANGVVTLAEGGGGGRGAGIGEGSGDGAGPGEGTGFGGGVARLGAGIDPPVLLRQVRPEYTAEAMRAKITGVVWLEAVIGADGVVGDVRVTRSLDRVYGLDQEAIKAARQWVFKPATDRTGKPVAILVTLQLEFALH
jgi:protein TonB